MDLAFERDDWLPTPAAQALLRGNRPVLAYLAGKPAAFTSQDHVFAPGETIEKQLIVLNDSRVAVAGEATWTFALPNAQSGRIAFQVAPGAQERLLLRGVLPANLAPGDYAVKASVRF